MKIYKSRWFAGFARRQNISDAELCEAIERANRGLVDADLGGGVIKQRIARPGQGKSGGFRTLVFFRVQERAFFSFGFSKNDQDNISPNDLKTLKETARLTLGLKDEEVKEAVQSGKWIEVNCDEEDLQE